MKRLLPFNDDSKSTKLVDEYATSKPKDDMEDKGEDGIEKSAVLQEAAAVFNDPAIVKKRPKACCALITKLLYLLAQGESFDGQRGYGGLLAVSRLFQSKDLNLRKI